MRAHRETVSFIKLSFSIKQQKADLYKFRNCIFLSINELHNRTKQKVYRVKVDVNIKVIIHGGIDQYSI
jgi:hypothetical protein